MPIYMLNLIFDAEDTTAAQNGRFQEFVYNPNPTAPPLQMSKAWLVATVTNPDKDTENDWDFYQADTGYPITFAQGDQIQVRVMGLNTTSTWTARMTTIVARATSASKEFVNLQTGKPYQQHASPFQLGQAVGQSCVIYDYFNQVYRARSQPEGVTWGSWVQPDTGYDPADLAAVVTITTPNPIPRYFRDSYSAIVAFTGADGATQQVYSHDPDMDVEC